PFFDAALAGDVEGTRRRGSIALAAADAALRIDEADRAARYLEEAASDPGTASVARQRQASLAQAQRAHSQPAVQEPPPPPKPRTEPPPPAAPAASAPPARSASPSEPEPPTRESALPPAPASVAQEPNEAPPRSRPPSAPPPAIEPDISARPPA